MTYVPCGWVPILLNTDTKGFEKSQIFANVTRLNLLAVGLCKPVLGFVRTAVQRCNSDWMSKSSENSKEEEALDAFTKACEAV